MSLLPIDCYEHAFHQSLPSSHLVVEAETGSGKSTRLPVWAAKHGRVLVIEPRRIACTSLAEYLATSSGKPLGEDVGYAIKLDAKYSESTKVTFVTPGVALRWLVEDGLKTFDIVVVDEFHERRWDIDLLVAILKARSQHRLIVTSATIEGAKLAHYLDAERITCEGRNYHVSIEHRALDSRHLPDSRNIERRVADEVKQQLEACMGDILVFLPGKKEILQTAQMLHAIEEIEVCPLYASVSDSERNRALSDIPLDTPQRKTKVILATNVAETSLTIPNIALVVDSGLERRTAQRNGRTTLTLKAISRASAKQRAGRAGRVMDGQCVRLFGEHAALELVTPPEMRREELIEPMLAAACCQMTFEGLDLLDELPEKSLLKAKQALLLMEAIDEKGMATEHGQRMYPLPIDALHADIVTRIKSKALKEAMIDLTAALSVPARLYQLPNNPEHLDALFKEEREGCDIALLIGLVRGKQFPHVTVDKQALLEAQGLAEQMRELFELPQLEVASRFNRVDLLKEILRLHPELAFVRRTKRREAFANGQLEVMLGRENRVPDGSEALVVLDTYSLPGRGVKQTLTLATTVAPLPLSLLVDQELGEWKQGDTVVEEQADRSGQVYTVMSLVYAGRVIDTKQIEAQGQLSLKPVIDMVVSEQYLRGFAKQRTQEIKHWQLYVRMGLSESHEHSQEIEKLNFVDWFAAQLEELGVSQVDELEMFNAEDIPFAGIPYWEYEEFAEKYPFHLSLADLHIDVEYLPQRKLVYVHYSSGGRKTPPKRWELPVWSGWRIQYKKASRIVDVK
ncbi:DEAD/DEAH box helicase [Vibrio pelagius]|uniref:DEAD/DEAH box helicase n=1 Tax=Vibrio pelagius TaxID=28169 RepID=A0ABY5G4S3_VIBPE|nr:helicase-related protein [Vibrio pelagius]UTT84935.1 DEAD/DEAH box helicase [Vibrio pelagius]